MAQQYLTASQVENTYESRKFGNQGHRQLASRKRVEHIDPCPACEQRKGSVDAKKKRMDEDDIHATSIFPLPFFKRLQKKRMDEDHMRNDGKESDLRPSAVYQVLFNNTVLHFFLHCRLYCSHIKV